MLMTHSQKSSRGISLIEVLVTIVILLVGLLGLAGLQGRALTSQMEAYQRSQALILLKDMAHRINANRTNAPAYVTTTRTPYAYLGTDNAAVTNCTVVAIGQARDFCEWNNALLGAAEKQSGGNVGAMIGARGCVTQLSAGGVGISSDYLIQVVWQGLNSTAASPGLTCGQNLYPNATSPNEALRRVVSLPISIANLN